MANILTMEIYLLEPTGVPVAMGASPKYQYRVVVTQSGGALPGGAYDATRDVPDYLYTMKNRLDAKFLRDGDHAGNPSGLCAYVLCNGEVAADPDSWFCSCSFDTGTVAATRNIDPANLPLIVFGTELSDTARQEIGTVYAPFNDRTALYDPREQTVGLSLGFNNDSLILGGNGTAHTTGITAPESIPLNRSDQATYYLVMDDLPVNNYTGGQSQGKPNKIVGLITLKTRADDLYYPSENKTEVYVDLHNPSALQYNNLSFRIVDKEGRDVKDIYNYTIMTLEVRQNPNVALREMFKGLAQELRVDKRADFKSAGTGIRINSMGQ